MAPATSTLRIELAASGNIHSPLAKSFTIVTGVRAAGRTRKKFAGKGNRCVALRACFFSPFDISSPLHYVHRVRAGFYDRAHA